MEDKDLDITFNEKVDKYIEAENLYEKTILSNEEEEEEDRSITINFLDPITSDEIKRIKQYIEEFITYEVGIEAKVSID